VGNLPGDESQGPVVDLLRVNLAVKGNGPGFYSQPAARSIGPRALPCHATHGAEGTPRPDDIVTAFNNLRVRNLEHP